MFAAYDALPEPAQLSATAATNAHIATTLIQDMHQTGTTDLFSDRAICFPIGRGTAGLPDACPGPRAIREFATVMAILVWFEWSASALLSRAAIGDLTAFYRWTWAQEMGCTRAAVWAG